MWRKCVQNSENAPKFSMAPTLDRSIFFSDGVEQKTYIIFRTEFRDLSIYRKTIGIRGDWRELVFVWAKFSKMSRNMLATLCGKRSQPQLFWKLHTVFCETISVLLRFTRKLVSSKFREVKERPPVGR